MSITKEFEDSLQWAGSIVQECVCGRVHFVSEGDYDAGEYESLHHKAKDDKDGDHYIEHECDFIRFALVNGAVPYVEHCPCGKLAVVENFLWNNRESIIKYFKARNAKEQAHAARFAENLA